MMNVSHSKTSALVNGSVTRWVDVGPVCNDRCGFCPVSPQWGGIAREGAALVDEINRACAEGCDEIVLFGGEPTIHPQFMAAASRIADAGMKTSLFTNGRMFAYAHFCRKFAAVANAGTVYVAFHGIGQMHELAVGTASYEEVLSGLRNMVGAGMRVVLRVVVSTLNCDALGSIIETAGRLGVAGVRFAGPSHRGSGAEFFVSKGLGMERMLGAVRDAIGTAIGGVGHGLDIEMEGVPHCLCEDAGFTPVSAAEMPLERAYHFKPPVCAGCVHRGECSGVPHRAADAWADLSLQPTLPEGGEPKQSVLSMMMEEARVDVSPRYPDVALLTLMVPRCALNCVFCSVPQGRVSGVVSTLASVCASLRSMRKRASRVFFTGGEPSALPWLEDAISYARELGYGEIIMQSHVGAAADPEVASAWVEAGLTGVDIPFYGHEPALHEVVTATPGSFDATLKGALALSQRGVRLVLHTTLMKQNLQALSQLLTFFASLQPAAAYVQLLGALGTGPQWLRWAVHPREAADVIEGVAPASPPGLQWHVTDVPACYLKAQRTRLVGWHGEESEAAPVVLPYSGWLKAFTAGGSRRHVAVCEGCSLRQRCDGVGADVLEAFGPLSLEAV